MSLIVNPMADLSSHSGSFDNAISQSPPRCSRSKCRMYSIEYLIFTLRMVSQPSLLPANSTKVGTAHLNHVFPSYSILASRYDHLRSRIEQPSIHLSAHPRGLAGRGRSGGVVRRSHACQKVSQDREISPLGLFLRAMLYHY